jgi:hypothetical protein
MSHFIYCYAESQYAECRIFYCYGECQYAECRNAGAPDLILSVEIFLVVLNVAFLCFVVKPSIIILGVGASQKPFTTL